LSGTLTLNTNDLEHKTQTVGLTLKCLIPKLEIVSSLPLEVYGESWQVAVGTLQLKNVGNGNLYVDAHNRADVLNTYTFPNNSIWIKPGEIKELQVNTLCGQANAVKNMFNMTTNDNLNQEVPVVVYNICGGEFTYGEVTGYEDCPDTTIEYTSRRLDLVPFNIVHVAKFPSPADYCNPDPLVHSTVQLFKDYVAAAESKKSEMYQESIAGLPQIVLKHIKYSLDGVCGGGGRPYTWAECYSFSQVHNFSIDYSLFIGK